MEPHFLFSEKFSFLLISSLLFGSYRWLWLKSNYEQQRADCTDRCLKASSHPQVYLANKKVKAYKFELIPWCLVVAVLSSSSSSFFLLLDKIMKYHCSEIHNMACLLLKLKQVKGFATLLDKTQHACVCFTGILRHTTLA